MANPVLSRPEAFQRQGQYPQPSPEQGYQAYGQQGYTFPGQQYPQAQQPYAPYQQPTQGTMTIEDVITKSGIILGLVFLVGAATFTLVRDMQLLAPIAIVSAIVGFVTVLVVSLRRRVSPAAVVAYGVVEGVFIGALSKMFEFLYPGIALQAVLATFVAAGLTLAAYKYLRIRVTDKFRKIVFTATLGIGIMYLLNLVLSLFHINLGLVQVGPTAGVLSWIVSAVAIVLAVSNLIMDFDYIERGVANGAPASESWRAAFGLTVTMVWLYTELLRLLSYFRSN